MTNTEITEGKRTKIPTQKNKPGKTHTYTILHLKTETEPVSQTLCLSIASFIF